VLRPFYFWTRMTCPLRREEGVSDETRCIFRFCLTVENLEASKSFYEKLGLEFVAETPPRTGFVMKNEDNHIIGLFHGKIREEYADL